MLRAWRSFERGRVASMGEQRKCNFVRAAEYPVCVFGIIQPYLLRI